MAFLEWVKAQFDRGGIGMKLELPKEFQWSDGEIPLTIVLTGHKAEPRSVRGLRFRVADDEKTSDNDTPSGTRVRHEWEREGAIELGAAEQLWLGVSVPLPNQETREEIEQRAFGREASGFMEKAFMAVAGGAPPSSIDRYLVTVEADVEGAHKPKRASKHLRQRRGPALGIGGVSVQL